MKVYISKIEKLISDIKETEKTYHEAIQLVQTPTQRKINSVMLSIYLTKSVIEGSPMEKLAASAALATQAHDKLLATATLCTAVQALKVRRLGLSQGLVETTFWAVTMNGASLMARTIDSK